jgi:hypothetical protein
MYAAQYFVRALGGFDYTLEREATPIPRRERICLNDSTWRRIPTAKSLVSAKTLFGGRVYAF